MAPLILSVAFASGLYLTIRLIVYTWSRVFHPPFGSIAGPPTGSLITGNYGQLFSHDAWGFIEHLMNTYGPVARLYGFFNTPWLHIYDPKALHSIIKDQDAYYRGEVFNSFTMLFFGPGLFATSGAMHTKQRKLLNPVFSGAHIRDLTPVFHEVAQRLKTAIWTRVRDGPKTLDVVSWTGRASLEMIGQGGLGYSFDPLTEDSRDEYTDAVKTFAAVNSDLQYLHGLIPYVVRLGPAWLRRAILDIIPSKAVQRSKDNYDTITRGCAKLFNAKKAAIEAKDENTMQMVVEGKDVMSVLLRENVLASNEDKLPDEELFAQMAMFIIAGTDTTSNALARILHILCNRQDAQDMLRDELREARERHGAEISYDDLNKLSHLDAVCRETLRLHPPVNLSFKEACTDTVVPLSEPIRGTDGRLISEIPVPKGSTLLLNLRACNTNKALWGEDAEEWKPERWLQPLPRAVEQSRIPGIYANLMTFLGGGYSCIGFKFSLLEMKIVLYTLILSFKFELSDTPVVWNFGGVVYPATSRESSKPEMYLTVSLASGCEP